MSILQDVRYTVRALRANRGFAIAAILCTALGVGATATIFSAVHATLIRPLPFDNPDELVAVYGAIPAKNVTGANVSYPDYVELARREQELRGARHLDVEFAVVHRRLASGARNVSTGAEVTANLFRLLGVQPDPRPHVPRYRRRARATTTSCCSATDCGSDGLPAIATSSGSTVTIDLEPYTVVGVMPRGFAFPEQGPGVGAVRAGPERGAAVTAATPGAIGRLKPGVSRSSCAHRDLDAIMARLAREFPEENEGWRADLVDDARGSRRQPAAPAPGFLRGRRAGAAHRVRERREPRC